MHALTVLFLVLSLLWGLPIAEADTLADLDARLAAAVAEKLEARAAERLPLPDGLPELPATPDDSLPAAPAADSGGQAIEPPTGSAP